MADEQLNPPLRTHVIKSKFNPETYEYSDRFEKGDPSDPLSVHTTHELIECLERNPNVQVDSIVLGLDGKKKNWGMKRLDRNGFLTAFREGEKRLSKFNFRESFLSDDPFSTDGALSNSGLIGDDFVPFLGGPFFKQLYFYDYIRMHNLCFWALHHDPIARHIVNLTRDFTLGRGFRVDTDNKAALALWRAFEQVNDVQGMMDQIARELCTYGETMVWKLPDNQVNISYNPTVDQVISKGLLPRIRLIDPSVIWEIVTWPEDIKKVLSYVWVAPTQYQIYSGLSGQTSIPSTKFIFQTIPANQVRHYRVNSVSNEKRGRSDLFPALGYMKRLRDSVNFQVVGLQKQAAWSIDTTIEGSQADVDGYISAMDALGPTAPAGSDFVHTSKIKREYLSAQGMSRGAASAFEWCMSMIAAGVGIPTSYFGSHLSGGQTRASALVATEPVAKKFEMRQLVYERILGDMFDDLMTQFGLGKVDKEITFPEIIAQDRSAKLKDLALCVTEGWISKERAATIAAKELGISEFEYDEEQADIAKDPAPAAPAESPLTSPGLVSSEEPTPKPSAVTKSDRRGIAQNG